MTVKELISILIDLDEDLLIILSSDAEGNWYSPLYDVDEVMYTARNGDEVYMTNEQVDADSRYSDEDRPPEDAFKVVALWPA